MSDELTFDVSPPARSGECLRLSPLVRRVVANNAGPITFTGTCSYIVGNGHVAIIDPGPDLPEHVDALLHAVRGETVTHILVTHTHKDHSPAARAVKAATGATLVGCGMHRSARALALGEINLLETSSDKEYAPDWEMTDDDAIAGRGWTLEAIATPGHMANHLAFSLPEEASLFSGDHVMAWSTSVVAPPDGAMSDYMASLDKLRGRDEEIYWPGHGGPVRDPQRFVRALVHHRRQREISILNRLAVGDTTIPTIVAAIYQGLKPALVNAAGLSVFAHLEDLVMRGAVITDGVPSLDSHYTLA
jgi:glyoxylase-like metal-dependent hydrolase (beta-lactamase superfamily II)